MKRYSAKLIWGFVFSSIVVEMIVAYLVARIRNNFSIKFALVGRLSSAILNAMQKLILINVIVFVSELCARFEFLRSALR